MLINKRQRTIGIIVLCVKDAKLTADISWPAAQLPVLARFLSLENTAPLANTKPLFTHPDRYNYTARCQLSYS